MVKMRSLIFSAFMVLASTPSFAGVNDDIAKQGQYWQRVHASSQLFLRGPKAQQILNRDIARCVVELRELERLGAVKNAIPEYVDGAILSEHEARIAGWDTPERDKDLFAEHSDYADFEGCMLARGWERIKFVPYEVAAQGVENYKKSHVKYRKSVKRAKFKGQKRSDFDNLNN